MSVVDETSIVRACRDLVQSLAVLKALESQVHAVRLMVQTHGTLVGMTVGNHGAVASMSSVGYSAIKQSFEQAHDLTGEHVDRVQIYTWFGSGLTRDEEESWEVDITEPDTYAATTSASTHSVTGPVMVYEEDDPIFNNSLKRVACSVTSVNEEPVKKCRKTKPRAKVSDDLMRAVARAVIHHHRGKMDIGEVIDTTLVANAAAAFSSWIGSSDQHDFVGVSGEQKESKRWRAVFSYVKRRKTITGNHSWVADMIAKTPTGFISECMQRIENM